VNHRHELFGNRVASRTLSAQIAKSFTAHVASDRDCHLGRYWWAAHPLVLELLDDVIQKGRGALIIENAGEITLPQQLRRIPESRVVLRQVIAWLSSAGRGARLERRNSSLRRRFFVRDH
jgi:hypothetical protein